MIIKTAQFVKSSVNNSQCPPDDMPEYAFIGRSNVGKSSLINMLTGQTKLAKISGTPGKTQQINHFIINEEWYLVDLPGYGYAKVSKTERKKWEQFIRDYIIERANLVCLFVLVDSRHMPQAIDMEFINWLGENGVPFSIIFTKLDKQSKSKFAKHKKAYIAELKQHWQELPQILESSAVHSTGKEEILQFIDDLNKQIELE